SFVGRFQNSGFCLLGRLPDNLISLTDDQPAVIFCGNRPTVNLNAGKISQAAAKMRKTRTAFFAYPKIEVTVENLHHVCCTSLPPRSQGQSDRSRAAGSFRVLAFF